MLKEILSGISPVVLPSLLAILLLFFDNSVLVECLDSSISAIPSLSTLSGKPILSALLLTAIFIYCLRDEEEAETKNFASADAKERLEHILQELNNASDIIKFTTQEIKKLDEHISDVRREIHCLPELNARASFTLESLKTIEVAIGAALDTKTVLLATAKILQYAEQVTNLHRDAQAALKSFSEATIQAYRQGVEDSRGTGGAKGFRESELHNILGEPQVLTNEIVYMRNDVDAMWQNLDEKLRAAGLSLESYLQAFDSRAIEEFLSKLTAIAQRRSELVSAASQAYERHCSLVNSQNRSRRISRIHRSSARWLSRILALTGALASTIVIVKAFV